MSGTQGSGLHQDIFPAYLPMSDPLELERARSRQFGKTGNSSFAGTGAQLDQHAERLEWSTPSNVLLQDHLRVLDQYHAMPSTPPEWLYDEAPGKAPPCFQARMSETPKQDLRIWLHYGRPPKHDVVFSIGRPSPPRVNLDTLTPYTRHREELAARQSEHTTNWVKQYRHRALQRAM